MKTTFNTIIAAAAAIVCYSCQNNGEPSIAASLQTDSIGCELKDSINTIHVAGDFAPVFTIAEWMNEMLGGDYAGDCLDGQKMFQFYVNKTKELFDAERASWGEDAPQDLINTEYIQERDFAKDCETDKYITYTLTTDFYLGGAHGSYEVSGQTFRKQDGRRIGWEILNNDKEEDIQQLLKDGLKEYFEVSDEEAFQSCFLNEADYYYVPLPKCPPLFTQEGILVQYQQYEIAAYALGLPGFTIPYDRIRSCLNITGQRLIE